MCPNDEIPRYPRREEREQILGRVQERRGAAVAREERWRILAPHGVGWVVDKGACEEASVDVKQRFGACVRQLRI